LIEDLSNAGRTGRLHDALDRYTHPHVLVIDEVGYLTYGPEAANVLYHVVNDRHLRKRPMVFTTNQPMHDWGRVLHDPDLASAILDRVLERGRWITLDGPSGRTKHLKLDPAVPQDGPGARVSGKPVPENPEPTLRGCGSERDGGSNVFFTQRRKGLKDVVCLAAPADRRRSWGRERSSRGSSRPLRGDGAPLGSAAPSEWPPVDPSLFRIRAEGIVRPRLPANSGRAIGLDDIAIDSQTDELLGRALLWTALAAVATDGRYGLLRQDIPQRASGTYFLCRPLGVFGVRTTWILSHTFAPLARWPAAG
jgi:hypothetical protein